MDKSVKKIIAYIMVIMILLFSVITLLGIWDVIDVNDLPQKLVSSLLVIFAASAVILFIFTVLIKEPEYKD